MAWGADANSPFRLNYESISRKLEEKKIQPRIRPENRDHVVVRKPNVIVHRLGPDTVALKLHRTNIVTYYANGDMVLDMGGYEESQMTRSWVREATGIYVYMVRPSKWTSNVLVCATPDGIKKYYDGIRFDRERRLIGDDEPIIKYLPNAEAKALKRQWMKVVREHYYPHCDMLETDENWRRRHGYMWAPQVATESLTKGEFNTDTLAHLLYSPQPHDRPHDIAKEAVKLLWSGHVTQHHMFDESIYQP